MDIQTGEDELEHRAKYFLMSLAWLNCYETEGKLAGPY
jgi:hypothetical protein